ncbi:hypothetical protein V2J09_004628 [Rumex salicifolius]
MSMRAMKDWPWIWRKIRVWNIMDGGVGIELFSTRCYSTKYDLKNLRPMILKRIEQRSGFYPVKDIIPVARNVLQARSSVINGVSVLLNHVPVLTCNQFILIKSETVIRFCSEVYIGEKGHLIRTCFGPKRLNKNKYHEWIKGGLNDIIVPVDTFHLDNMFQRVIKHDQRFDFDRIPAVVELCWQAGADPREEGDDDKHDILSRDDLTLVAVKTLKAWETLRSGVEKLLLTYPAKVCKHCSEVHVGPSGHKARLCGIFKYERWRGAHFWERAGVDDLVPPKVVWRRRPQDPPVLVDEGRGFYGHAPALVELCAQAGGKPPVKYHYMMKVQGLAPPV